MRSCVVLRDRECSTMVSAWDELLCVGLGVSKPYKLYLGQYEVIGERADCYDEEENGYVLPDHIDGKPAQKFMDDAVIGYEVENVSYREEDEFEFADPAESVNWLSTNNWLDETLLADLTTAIGKLLVPTPIIFTLDPELSRY